MQNHHTLGEKAADAKGVDRGLKAFYVKATLSDASIRLHQTALTTEHERACTFEFDSWPWLTNK